MQKLIYLGLLFSESSLDEAYKFSKKGVQMATHTFQENLIDGFLQHKEIDLRVINVPPVGSFPLNYRIPFIKNEKWGKNKQVGFLNLPIIKRFLQEKKIYKLVEKIIKEENGRVDLLFYSLYDPFLKVAKRIKKKYPFVSISMIQTDAVQGRDDMEKYMTPKRKREGDRLVEMAKCCDGFVLLAKDLKEPLEIGERPYTIVECIANENLEPSEQKENEKNICLYTGSIASAFNIRDLANAFNFLDNAELWICGAGEESGYLQELSKTNSNIKYFGFLSKEQVVDLQNQCDFLVNPRRPMGNYTKFSFPSKTVEYMMTGKPVVMYKLESIPDEYDEYLNYLTEAKPLGIAKELESLFALDYSELAQKAMRSRQFVLENKNGKVQTGKILDLIKSLKK